MKNLFRFFAVTVLFSLLLSACGGGAAVPTSPAPSPAPTEAAAPTAAAKPEEDVLYLNLVWHQHQPLYYKDADGVYTRPWVRAHATKDYYDMTAMVEAYPNVHVTVNLTPVLLRQLDDFIQNGAKDYYWVLAEKPAAELSAEEKDFIVRRFFDANWDQMIARFPRYQELLEKRGGTDEADYAAAVENFSEQDFRDLQIWFNLAWFDPDFLAEEPLKGLVDKGRDFSEGDKEILFAEVRKVMAEIIPLHRRLQDSGQIEVITTPYAHPILPLIYDTNLALVGNPAAEMPARFSWPNDAIAHLQRSVEIYESNFGRAPRGLWPGEGSVAQEVVPLIARAGYQWMGTGEPVLAQSLGLGSFTRDSKETVVEADTLYRPYYVSGPKGERAAVFFRDGNLSDKLGFEYSKLDGEAAADNFMERLENIRARLKEQGEPGPHVVSVILDGENAWEYYPNDGKAFLHGMYQRLNESQTIRTITPSEYLALYPEQREIEKLFPGAWFSPNYDTWIGESEEKAAWDYLVKTREFLAKYDVQKRRTTTPEKLARALDFMYLAEGSDWFWWYGSDQNSGVDEYFDMGYRALLAEVYRSLDEPVPAYVNVPILPARPEEPAAALNGISTPTVDGQAAEGEWAKAAQYRTAGKELDLTLDAKNLYLRLGMEEKWPADGKLGIYVNVPRTAVTQPFARGTETTETPFVLGISASHLVEWDGKQAQIYTASETGWEPAAASPAVFKSGADGIEAAIELAALGELQAGDDLRVVALMSPAQETMPHSGPAQVVIPDLGNATLVLEVNDPAGDDHGPGSYTYPTDGVFGAGAFDLKTFSVAVDGSNMVFKFTFNGPIPNPWSSPNNLAIQTLDVYVDTDPGQGTGARLLMPGRNAALAAGSGWDIALWAEGWYPAVVAGDASGGEPKKLNVEMKIIADPANQTVTLRVPKDVFGEGDPAAWGYAAAVMSQEGFPSTGVWRIRDVTAEGGQWKIGGGSGATNETRILDLIWPEGAAPTQEELLSGFNPSSAAVGELTADDFAQLPLITVQ